MQAPTATPAPIEGAWRIDLFPHDDLERPGSSFSELWHADRARELGLPAFEAVQWNVARSPRGTLRGIHAEPWDKLVHVVCGEAFAAIADLRPASRTAGEVWTATLDPSIALFIGRGLGNAYQVISDDASYAYLVNGRWQPGVRYPAVRWNDPDLAIEWPILDDRLALSHKDRSSPSLQELWSTMGR